VCKCVVFVVVVAAVAVVVVVVIIAFLIPFQIGRVMLFRPVSPLTPRLRQPHASSTFARTTHVQLHPAGDDKV